MKARLAKICPLLPFALLLALLLGSFPASAQEFVFPPELKWWICEIQKADKGVSLEKFKFSEERFIYEEDGFATYKNRLYPVFKKWNFYGDKFAYHDIFCGLQKKKGGKYSLLGEPEGAFAVFDRNETLISSEARNGWIHSAGFVTTGLSRSGGGLSALMKTA